MDAETEVSRGSGAEEGERMDTDEGLDTLLRKAVTVSQANLPLATINKDIDDIAMAYAKENERPDNSLDGDFVRLQERTRQRRKLLDQKLGKGPEASPRKRRSPLTEDRANVGSGPAQNEDSPKRQCLREKESAIKPDTPAIAGVKSRLQALSTLRAHWAEEGTENTGESSPVPTPRKSVASPPKEQVKPADTPSGAQPGSQRKSRFAQLASNISSWEDDLSHPTIVKEEEKKPRWQPPKAEENPTQSNSTRASHDPVPASASISSKTPKKSVTFESAGSSPAKRGAKAGSTEVGQTARSPVKPAASSTSDASKRAEPYSSRATGQEKEEAKTGQEAVQESRSAGTSKSMAEGKEVQSNVESSTPKKEGSGKDALKTEGHKKGAETPKVSMPPTERPLSARLVNWEQKISGSKPDVPATPKSALAPAGRATHSVKDSAPAHPLSTPSVEESEPVQMRPKPRRTVDDEPTAHSVSARMSAWEQISSAHEVSDIKKVKPGDCTPVKAASAQKSPSKTGAGTPAKASTQDGIKGRIAHFNTPQKAGSTPSKTPAVGSANKLAQWQLAQQSNNSDTAQRLRQERMAEVQGIQSRWKNGILRDDNNVEAEDPPTSEASAKKDRRQGTRDKARADQNEAEPSGISTTEDTTSNSDDRNVDKISYSEDEEEERDAESQVITATDSKVLTSDSTCTAANQDRQTSDQDMLEENMDNTDESGCEGNTHRTAVWADGSSLEPGYPRGEEEETVQTYENSPKRHRENAPAEEMGMGQNQTAKEREEKTDEGNSARQADSQSDEQMEISHEADEQTGIDGDQLDSEDGTAGENDFSDGTDNQTVTCEEPMDSVDSQSACTQEHKEHTASELPDGLDSSNFESKLASVGLDVDSQDKVKSSEEAALSTSTVPAASGSSVVTGKPPRPTSLFSVVSQQKAEAAPSDSPRPGSSKACRKVKFEDGFDDEDPQPVLPRPQSPQLVFDIEPAAQSDKTEEEQDDGDDDGEVVLRRPRPGSQQQNPKPSDDDDDDDDDDISLSAFVPRSVRYESVLPSERQCGQDLDSSINSLDSFEGPPGAPPDFHKSTVDLVKLGQQYADSDSCSSLDPADRRPQGGEESEDQPPASSAAHPHNMEESVDDRDAIGDLLDEAMDSDSEQVPSTSDKPPTPVMRKKNTQRKATRVGDLPFSINEYRASRNMQIQEVKQTIVRSSQYVGMAVKEEDVEMPACAPTPAPRRSVQDRIKELQDLVQQEQSIIMQTSNALNQCCSSSSHFAGSSEQVECNRILLLSCQKRAGYMTEIQRLKNSRVVDPSGPGPKGSLTVSDIRLPLKKEFVTKIGTSHDTMTYYFILLLKNGPQVISTQMLSTHDPMMRGSLDFPNLIKVNGITGSFQLQLDIYSMSVSCEHSGKDKKKKTPKKTKGNALTVQSPGGPLAVRTTSFSQVTTVLLTMKSVDKHSFSLDRLSHLSPLHGTIYMNLKCVMEANVEEKGFLTMFEDVSGLGSWHRRWCVLSANKLQFWKYPDDETRKDPMGYIDLKRCVTEKVGLISRDVCARPHTFELTSVRQPQRGEKDTLVSRTYTTMTTIRHMLSADTKEERIMWCNKINRALATIRTWHSDAVRPIPK